MLSIAELADRRNERAAEQAGAYSFTLISSNGQALVQVEALEPRKDGALPVYTVDGHGACTCPDYVHRVGKLRAEGNDALRCKHGLMAASWLADCAVPEAPPVETLETVTCGGCGEPKEGESCTLCGSTAVLAPSRLPVLTPEQAARFDRLRTERNLLWPA